MSALSLALFVLWAIVQSGLLPIGDTKLRVQGTEANLVDKRVLLRVTEFDEDTHVGESEYLETVGSSAF